MGRTLSPEEERQIIKIVSEKQVEYNEAKHNVLIDDSWTVETMKKFLMKEFSIEEKVIDEIIIEQMIGQKKTLKELKALSSQISNTIDNQVKNFEKCFQSINNIFSQYSETKFEVPLNKKGLESVKGNVNSAKLYFNIIKPYITIDIKYKDIFANTGSILTIRLKTILGGFFCRNKYLEIETKVPKYFIDGSKYVNYKDAMYKKSTKEFLSLIQLYSGTSSLHKFYLDAIKKIPQVVKKYHKCGLSALSKAKFEIL